MFFKHLILLVSTSVIVTAQCAGYNYYPNEPQCGVNNGDGTYLESNLQGAGPGCPEVFGHTYDASATYTDLSGAAQTVGLVTPVTTPADPTATIVFLYDVAYSNIKDGTPVTVNYLFNDEARLVTLPPFTLYNTIAYTDVTSTITNTVDAETTTTSTIPTTDATVKTVESTTTVTADILTTGAPKTVTSTSTFKPHPKTKKVYTVVHVTKTLSCIPNKRYVKRAEGDTTVFDGKTYAQLSCGNAVPATITLTTSTSFATSIVTTTDTEVSFTTSAVSTSTSIVKQTDVVSATDTVTVHPPPVTTTVCTVARRKTVYTTSTLTNTVYKYTGHKLCYPPPPYHPKPNPTCRIAPPKPKQYTQKHH